MKNILSLLILALLTLPAADAAAYLALLRQGTETNSIPEKDDKYGSAIVSADFDGDGYADVAVGSPWESNGLINAATHGVVHVNFGSSYGLKHTGVAEISPGVPLDDAYKFGSALAAGDFNGDGYADLAVGAHAADVGAAIDAGTVAIYEGYADGIQLAPSLVIDQSMVGETNEDYDVFGFTLVSGDFDDNGYDDLAIAALGEDGDMGRVTVDYGVGAIGLSTTTAQTWDPTSLGSGFDPTNNWFGKALATGDLDDDGFDDLVVGAPKAAVNGVGSAGRVHFFYGSPVGLSGNDTWAWDRTAGAWIGDAANEIGWSLAVGRFIDPDFDAPLQVAIGAPGFESNGDNDTGAFFVLAHDEVTRSVGGMQDLFEQPSSDVFDMVTAGDRFGQAMAAGDADGDGFDELAVGATGNDIAEQMQFGFQSNSGSAYLFDPGDTNSLMNFDEEFTHLTHVTLNDHVLAGDNLGYALAFGDTDGRGTDTVLVGAPYGDRESYDGGATVSNAGRIYVHAPWRQPRGRAHRGSTAFDCDGFTVYAQRAWQRMRPASTTKTITAKVACDFIDQGQDPGEWVRVRPWVTQVGGSSANHQANDQLRFRDLIKTMMTVSGNDSAMLLGSFMTNENLEAPNFLGWSTHNPDFAIEMEQQATDYGMSAKTSFTNAAGIDSGDHYVTPYDFALLTRQAIEDPCVKEIVEPEDWVVTVRRPINPGTQAPLDPIALQFSNFFVNSVRDLRPSTVGMKGGTTPGAFRTILANSYVNTVGKHSAVSGFGVWGNNRPANANDDCRECLASELLEISNLYCTGADLPGGYAPSEPQPSPWAYLSGVSTAEADTARGMVFDVSSGAGNDLGRQIQVDLLRTSYPWPAAEFEAIVRHGTDLCLPAGDTEGFGIAPYQRHDGIVVTNRGSDTIDLQIDASDPVGFSQLVTLAPDSSTTLAATDGSGAGATFELTITNLTLRAEACIEVEELGYRQDVVLGDGVQSDDVLSLLLTRSLLAGPETYAVEIHGRDALGGNLVDVSAHDPNTIATSVGPADDSPGAPRPVRSMLLPNVPNPFNPRTEVRFDLPRSGPVTLRVYDARGRAVRTLETGTMFDRGRHAVVWDGRDDTGGMAASGVYFVKLQTEGGNDTRRVMLVK